MNSLEENNSVAWEALPFPECLDESPISKPGKILARDYKTTGKIPIVDQGQQVIAGWTDDEALAIRDRLPVVVFGDHTRVFKFLDFPFALGADGTHLLKPKQAFNPRFFYYACLQLQLPSRGYNRHFTVLKERMLSKPPKPEQEKIAALLWNVQRCIEVTGKLIATARELKQSAMRSLFTRGLHGEPQKDTEFGPIPESWQLLPLGELIDVTHGYAFKSQFFRDSGPVVLTPGNFRVDGGLYWGPNTKFTSEVCNDDFHFQAGDLVTVMTDLTPSAKLLGSPAFIPAGKVVLHNQRIGKVVLRSKLVTKDFLYFLFLTRPFRNHIVMTATGSTVRHTSPGRIRSFVCPVPAVDEQHEIVAIMQTIDRKIAIHERKCATLEDLFKTLLHQLMTGKIRVHNLDIDVSGIQSP